MHQLLSARILGMLLAAGLLACGAYVTDNALAQLPVLVLLLLGSPPFLIVVAAGQCVAILALSYGLGTAAEAVPLVYAVAAAVLLPQDTLLADDARLPRTLHAAWRYVTQDLRFLFWLAAVGFAVAALFRFMPLVPLLGFAALYAFFALAMKRRYPASQSAPNTVASLLLLTVSILGCVGFLEGAARLLVRLDADVSGYLTPDPDYLYRLTPGFEGEVPFWPDSPAVADAMHVRISALGLRDRDYGAKADDEYRILLLGDSYTFGWAAEIEDALSRVIERDLRARFPARKISVINGGTGGYGPWQTHGTLRRAGAALAPDLVVLQTNTANDISDTLRKEGTFLKSFVAPMEKTMQRYRYHFLWQVQAEQWLRDHCRLYYIASRAAGDEALLLNAWNAFRLVTPLAIGRVPQPDPRPWNYEPDLVEWYPELERGWALMQEDVLAMKRDSEALGAAFALYNMPNPFDIEKGRELLSGYPGRYVLDKNSAIVRDFCRERGIDWIPVLPVFRNHPNPGQLYYHNDGHLNPAGTALLAEELADSIAATYLGAWSPDVGGASTEASGAPQPSPSPA